MAIELRLGVYRRLDNRLRGESDDSAFALELHERRKRALMDAFGTDDEIRVLDWGFTKDDRSHELVELMLGAAGSAALKYVVVPGLKLLGEKLIELGAETAAAEVVKAVVSRLRPKQEAQAINDFYIGLPDGTRVQVMPPDGGGTAEIWAKDGTTITVNFAARAT